MALRIGKNKTPNPSPADTPPADTPIADSPLNFDEFSNIPSESTEWASTAAAPSAAPIPVPAPTPAPGGKKPRKSPPVALLGALGLLLVVGIGAGAYTFMHSDDAAEEAPAEMPITHRKKPGLVPPRRIAQAPVTKPVPAKPGISPVPPPKTPVVKAPVAKAPTAKTPATKSAMPRPAIGQPGRPVPGKAMPPKGATLSGAKTMPPTPASKKPAAGAKPPVQGTPQPTPVAAIVDPVIYPVPGAQPGVHSDPNEVRYVKKPGEMGSSFMIQLKKFWYDGKNAKAKKNYLEARRIWQQGMTLASSNPATAKSALGFKGALAKLPKSPK